MDSVFLFCYPVWQYFEAYIEQWDATDASQVRNSCYHMFDMIDARYRQKGYKVFWMTFGKDEDRDEPDKSHLWPHLQIKKDDALISGGISAWDMFGEEEYADPEYVCGRLGTLKRLVVGGFHAYDCVERVAQFAYQDMGLENTMIDIDITELLYPKCLPPLVRTSFTPLDYLPGTPSPFIVQAMDDLWKDNPWVRQRNMALAR